MNSDPQLHRVNPEDVRLPFDCDNDDLNEFYHKDSKEYALNLYAVTYALIDGSRQETLAFYSVSNDSIRREDFDSRARYKKFIPFSKRGYESHPSVKIGRFAVNKTHQRAGIGSMLLDYIKGSFITNNKTGCRFIVVDSYKDSTSFYKTNGFEFLCSEDAEEETRLMYYDLIKFASL